MSIVWRARQFDKGFLNIYSWIAFHSSNYVADVVHAAADWRYWSVITWQWCAVVCGNGCPFTAARHFTRGEQRPLAHPWVACIEQAYGLTVCALSADSFYSVFIHFLITSRSRRPTYNTLFVLWSMVWPLSNIGGEKVRINFEAPC